MTHPPTGSDAPLPVRILALDLLMSLRADLPRGEITTATFAELDADLLAQLAPDQVLLPLLSPDHDATMVIERLQALGYTGLITVVSLPLPNARMVETELRALGPGARLTLLTP